MITIRSLCGLTTTTSPGDSTTVPGQGCGTPIHPQSCVGARQNGRRCYINSYTRVAVTYQVHSTWTSTGKQRWVKLPDVNWLAILPRIRFFSVYRLILSLYQLPKFFLHVYEYLGHSFFMSKKVKKKTRFNLVCVPMDAAVPFLSLPPEEEA